MRRLKKKYKSLVCITVCVLSFLTIPTLASSIERPFFKNTMEKEDSFITMGLDCPRRVFCVHSEIVHAEAWTPHFRYSAINNKQHTGFSNWRHVCQVCGEGVEGWDRDDKYLGNHTYTPYQDLGHKGRVHKYQRSCTVCGYVQDVTLNCSGSPCVAPYSMNE